MRHNDLDHLLKVTIFKPDVTIDTEYRIAKTHKKIHFAVCSLSCLKTDGSTDTHTIYSTHAHAHTRPHPHHHAYYHITHMTP